MLICGIVTIFLVFMSSTAFSAVWRVNPIEGAGADFTSINDAVASISVLNGDTLYLEGSGTSLSTGNVTITKTLNIIGPGYYLSQYPDTQANIASATISNHVYFNSGSSGSLVKGVNFEGTVFISTPDFTIKRCRFTSNLEVGKSSAADNTVVMQNCFVGYGILLYNSSQNVIISNNILVGSYAMITVNSGCTAGISNNVINNTYYSGRTALTLNDSTATNNIIISGGLSSANSTFYNNIGNSTQFGTENGNQSNVVMNNVFLFVGTTDGQYQLMTGSPAIGAGVDGVDCGAFGGDTPYVLGGIPDYPAIYYFTSPLTSTQDTGLPVRIKTKVNN
jgi:hypothetical protein